MIKKVKKYFVVERIKGGYKVLFGDFKITSVKLRRALLEKMMKKKLYIIKKEI